LSKAGGIRAAMGLLDEFLIVAQQSSPQPAVFTAAPLM
jgi:hypothetical protein